MPKPTSVTELPFFQSSKVKGPVPTGLVAVPAALALDQLRDADRRQVAILRPDDLHADRQALGGLRQVELPTPATGRRMNVVNPQHGDGRDQADQRDQRPRQDVGDGRVVVEAEIGGRGVGRARGLIGAEDFAAGVLQRGLQQFVMDAVEVDILAADIFVVAIGGDRRQLRPAKVKTAAENLARLSQALR